MLHVVATWHKYEHLLWAGHLILDQKGLKNATKSAGGPQNSIMQGLLRFMRAVAAPTWSSNTKEESKDDDCEDEYIINDENGYDNDSQLFCFGITESFEIK